MPPITEDEARKLFRFEDPTLNGIVTCHRKGSRRAPVTEDDVAYLLKLILRQQSEIEQMAHPITLGASMRLDERLEGHIRLRQAKRTIYANHEGFGSTGPAWAQEQIVWQAEYVDDLDHVLGTAVGLDTTEAGFNLAITLGQSVSHHEDAARERNG